MGGYHKDALPPGHQLADYVIDSVLGVGGFGITYLANDSQLNSQVAIKEYLPKDISRRVEETRVLPNPDAPNGIQDYHWGLKEFLKEARHLVKFKHPNIVRVLRFMEANGTAYMVMEYEEGQSLSYYLKHRRGRCLDENEFLRVFLPVLNGLSAVHDAGMLHLDIKPDNIYLRKDKTSMLIDFGSARQAITGHDHTQRITLTHGFAPIEQYPDKGEPGLCTDIYAMGASMYYSICGKRPEVSINRYQTLLKHQDDPVTPARQVSKNKYPDYVLNCIDWALQIYDKDRPQTARQLQDGLMGKGAPKPEQLVPRIRIPSADSRAAQYHERRFNRWWLVLIIVGLFAGGAYYKKELTRKWWGQTSHLIKDYASRLESLIKR